MHAQTSNDWHDKDEDEHVKRRLMSCMLSMNETTKNHNNLNHRWRSRKLTLILLVSVLVAIPVLCSLNIVGRRLP